ncbi:MAG: ABC transporter ATP-binding protein [Clostridia bacterium]|nr:ABC transporter ATP-binding protein [Clostridia bacterium]
MNRITCHDLTKKYGSKTALDHVNLELESGQIVGLLGPNGSGKTTLIKLCCRLLQPTSGEILINGQKPGKASKASIAFLPDRDFLPDYMRVSQLVTYYADFFQDFDRERAHQLLSSLQIDEKTPLKRLSKGNREKTQLVLTMSRQAEIYILDEPIAGVDPAARDFILRTIIANYEKNALVLISTHLIADVEPYLDRILFLKNGQFVLDGDKKQICAERGMSIDSLFREEFEC